jgi:hypothetical protein
VGGRLARSSTADSTPERTAAITSARGERTRAVAPVFIPAGSNGVDPDELRRIIREELARQKAESDGLVGAGADSADSPTEQPPLTPELEAQKAEASSLVDRAVSSGTWTNRDRELFSETTRGLPPVERIELERKVHIALNLGKLAIDDGRPPFGSFGPAR